MPSQPPAIADRSAQPVRQTSPSAWSSTACRSTEGSPSSRRLAPSRVCAWASVMIRQRLLQPRSSRTSRVMWRGCSLVASAGRGQVDLGAVDRPHPVGLGGLGQLHRARQRVVVGQRDRPIAQLARALAPAPRAARRRPGTSRPSGSAARHMGTWTAPSHPVHGPCKNQRPEHRSWKTTTLRPRTPTSSQ